MERVLLAIGEENFSRIIREKTSTLFDVIERDVYHWDYLDNSIIEYRPDIVIIHDYYLEHRFQNDKDKESFILELFQSFRERFDDSVRIVYICERDKQDPFLSQLVSLNVLDIFNERSFSTKDFLNQLQERPKYSNVKKFVNHDSVTKIPSSTKDEPDNESVNDEIDSNESTEPKVKTKVVKEKVIKEKVVYKDNVIHTPSKLIGVVNVTSKAGSSFLTTLIAKALSEHDISVTVTDQPFYQEGKTYLFHLLGLHMSFESYFSIHQSYRRFEDLTKHNVPNQTHDGINWQVVNPEHRDDITDWERNETLDLTRLFSDHVTLIDLGYMSLKDTDEVRLLHYLDHVVFVSSVIPHDIDANHQRIEYVQKHLNDLNAKVVLNKWSDELKKQGLTSLFDKKQSLSMPILDESVLIQSFYNRTIPYEFVLENEQAEEVIRDLVQSFVPHLTWKGRKKGLFKRLISKA
ncbi:hypothetical protein ACTWQB_16905 [Piscibacillus sp. B03]|uniref:hypothetical protein n=1 Tax=Piscibacillus sp. B03 TaxID=3457430 RepID=UPI003FCE0384